MSLRIRRGSDAERLGVRFDQGEIVWVQSTTTSRPAYKLYVGDGVTQGGRDILDTSAGNKLTYNTNTGRLDVTGLTTDDIAPGINNKFFTPELAQDAVGAMFSAGTMSGIQFVYDDIANKMNVTVTATGGGGTPGDGITALVDDPSPELGGTLNLNNQNIIGTGNIDITGNISASGTIIATSGLGANLSLNGFDISNDGNIDITGNIGASGTIIATSGLGANLGLNSFSLNGEGNIDIDGNITASGDISIFGDITTNGGGITGAVSGTFNGQVIAGDSTVLINSSTRLITNGDISLSANTISSTSDNYISVGSAVNRTNMIINQGINDIGFVVTAQSDGAQGLGQYAARLQLKTSAGTLASPTILADGDICGQMNFAGYVNGGDDETAGFYDLAVIRSVVTGQGDLVSSKGTGKLQLIVTNLNDPLNSKIAQLDINGVFSAPVIQTGVYATTPTDLRPSFPTKGMIIFNDTDGTFQGYNGTAWVNLS